MSYGKIIKEKRKELKLTQEQLAKIVGVDRAAISQWENEITSPTKKNNLKKLCETLNIQPSILIDDSSMNNHHIFGTKKHITNSTIKEVGRDNIEVGSNTEELKELREFKKQQESRPSLRESHLRIIVEWIELEYGSDPIKGLHFFQEFQEKFPGFRDSLK